MRNPVEQCWAVPRSGSRQFLNRNVIDARSQPRSGWRGQARRRVRMRVGSREEKRQEHVSSIKLGWRFRATRPKFASCKSEFSLWRGILRLGSGCLLDTLQARAEQRERLVLERGGFGGEGDRGARGLRRGDDVERHGREMAREVAEAGDGRPSSLRRLARLRLAAAESSTAATAMRALSQPERVGSWNKMAPTLRADATRHSRPTCTGRRARTRGSTQ